MDFRDRNVRVGLLLIVLGVLGLLGQFGWLEGFGNLVGTALFALAAALVLAQYRRRRERLWTLPVGFGLAGLALATLDTVWGGGAFLGGIGLGFVAIYVESRPDWWALIPGGILLSLGFAAITDEAGRGDGGAGFFLGLAITFLVVYALPDARQRWAIYPAGAAAVLAVVAFGFGAEWIFPLVLLALGAYLLLRPERPAVAADATVEEGPGAAPHDEPRSDT